MLLIQGGRGWLLRADDLERKVLFSGLSGALPRVGHLSCNYRRACGVRPGLWADSPRPGAEKLPGPPEGRARQDAGGGTGEVTAEVMDGDRGGGGDGGKRPRCSSPSETSSHLRAGGTEPRSRRSASPGPAPPRSLTAAAASPVPPPQLRAAPPARPARLRRPPRGAPGPRAPHVAAGTSRPYHLAAAPSPGRPIGARGAAPVSRAAQSAAARVPGTAPACSRPGAPP